MKLTIAMVLFLVFAICLLETGLQTGLHWVSQLGFGFCAYRRCCCLLTCLFLSLESFKTNESHVEG